VRAVEPKRRPRITTVELTIRAQVPGLDKAGLERNVGRASASVQCQMHCAEMSRSACRASSTRADRHGHRSEPRRPPGRPAGGAGSSRCSWAASRGPSSCTSRTAPSSSCPLRTRLRTRWPAELILEASRLGSGGSGAIPEATEGERVGAGVSRSLASR
jgi:hypothetical protein